jgi:superoxide dismutase, Fe-Mn family
MSFELPPLPYPRDALAPTISGETLDYHHGKHHRAYVNKLNELVAANPDLAGKSLEDIIKTAGPGPVFNNAAQIWNHTFYWNSLSPNGGGEPTGALAAAITRDFGSLDTFKAEFAKAATGQFGSGWAWLVKDGEGKLKIVATGNAETPITKGLTPLLTCDVWEHAYYIDYRNDRPGYVAAFWKLANWSFAAQNLG